MGQRGELLPLADHLRDTNGSSEQTDSQSLASQRTNDPEQFPNSVTASVPTETTTEQSVTRLADYSVRAKSETPLTTQPEQPLPAQLFDFMTLAPKLSSQRGVLYDNKIWKRSRVKKGWLIRRIEGYSISETEYGVHYLFVISRKPDRTSGDMTQHPLAGFFNWQALQDAGRLVKEKRNEKQRGSQSG